MDQSIIKREEEEQRLICQNIKVEYMRSDKYREDQDFPTVQECAAVSLETLKKEKKHNVKEEIEIEEGLNIHKEIYTKVEINMKEKDLSPKRTSVNIQHASTKFECGDIDNKRFTSSLVNGITDSCGKIEEILIPGHPKSSVLSVSQLDDNRSSYKQGSETTDKDLICKEERKYACGNCNEKYSEICELKNHITAKHIGIGYFKCAQCNKTFFRPSDLIKHSCPTLKYSGKYECDVCKMQFSLMSNLKKHILVHGERRNVCMKCNRRFLEFYDLMNHVRVAHYEGRSDTASKKFISHKKIKRYSCEKCNKEYSGFRELKNHITKLHLEISDFKCEKCNKLFSRSHDFKIHLKSNGHKNFMKFECDFCNRKFSHLSLLKVHIGVHSRTKKYVCELCQKRFFIVSMLKLHMNSSHIKSRAFQCEQCNKAFVQKSQVKRHIKAVHSKIRDYECQTCNKKFQHRHHLTDHITCVHEKVKNFMCGQCNNRFSLMHHLKYHINYVHKGIKI